MSRHDFRISRPQLPRFDAAMAAEEGYGDIDARPEMLCFRGQTLALVRHFFELSCQAGRLPSLLGREFFRARVSHHAVPSFEEQVVFVRDVELCLCRLRQEHAEVVTLVGLYSFSREEAARMLQCRRRWVSQCLAEALDALSEIFLQAGLLREDRPDRRQRQAAGRPVPACMAAERTAVGVERAARAGGRVG
jgi:hypothetical protein